MFKFIVIFVLFIFVVLPYMNKSSDSARPAPVPSSQSGSQTAPQPYVSPLDQLEQAKPDAISPQGEIAEMFSIGSDFTDLQRQLKFKEIQGKIIEWRLPVYEVKQSGDGYTIQTSGRAKGEVFGPKYIGTFLRITPRSEDDRRFVERIKTGDFIKVKGVIEDVTMRNLDIKPAIIIDDERFPRQILGKAYGRYMSKYDCWHTVATDDFYGEEHYCMKVGKVDKVETGEIKRMYVLALGNVVDAEGNSAGGRGHKGMVGAFVADIRNGQAEVVASNAKMPMGSFGDAPDTWKFVKIGPNDYWGWQSVTGECILGECNDHNIILATYGKTVKNLAGFGSYYSDTITVRIALKIDSSSASSKVYPLLLEVTEEKEGKEDSKKSVKVPFDEKQWAWKYSK